MVPNAAIEVIERAPAAADSAPDAVDVAPAEVDAARAAASAPPSRGSTIEIVVGREDTLRHLSLEYLNRFDDKTLAEIRALNPTIASPDRIETGQHLRLPVHLRRKSLSPAEPAARIAPVSTREVNP
jgi:nucleoid-associated protein YgaU